MNKMNASRIKYDGGDIWDESISTDGERDK